MPRQQTQLLFGAVGQRAFVANDDGQTARAQHFPRAAQGHAEGIAIRLALAVQRLINLDQAVEQLQQALLAAPRLDFVVLVVAEHQSADAVVVPQRGPADQRRDLRRQHRLEHQPRAEEQPRALLDHDENRSLAFFMEQLGVRFLRARGDAPIDGAHIVAGLIHPHLIEVDATATEFRVMQADQRAALTRRGKQLYLAHAVTHLDQLGEADADTGFGGQGGVHGGQATATTSRIRCTTRS